MTTTMTTTTTTTDMTCLAGTGNAEGVSLWADRKHAWEGRVIPAYVLRGDWDGPIMGEVVSWAEYAHGLEKEELVYADGSSEPARLPAEMDPDWGPFVPGGMEVTYFEWAFWAREESYPPVAWEEVSLSSFAAHMAEKEADDRHNYLEDAARGYV